jgi:SAM-dependent methyltransferase
VTLEPNFSGAVARDYDEARALPSAVLQAVRERLVVAGLLGPDARVLDAGAGTGLFAEALLEEGCAYTGVDISRPMLQRFAGRPAGGGRIVQADLRALPLASACFDLVLAFRVFGAVPGWRRGVQECLRVLRPGGRLVIGRVERPAGSLHALVRDRRNAWLREHGFEVGRPGADDAVLIAAVASQAEPEAGGEPIVWTERVTPREQIEANLTGWRVLALDAGRQDHLRDSLAAALADRFGELDRPLEEQSALALRCFRKLG